MTGENTTPDPINGYSHLRELYFESDPEYKGRFTVPTLYDKKAKQIVSNEVRIIDIDQTPNHEKHQLIQSPSERRNHSYALS